MEVPESSQDKLTKTIPQRMMRPIGWSIIVAIALYAFFIVAGGDAQAVMASAAQFGVFGWGLLLSFSLLNFTLRYLRWHFYITRQDYPVPRLANLLYYVSGFAFITTPVKAGEVIRGWYLKQRHQVSYTHSMAALFTDRMMDVVAVVLLALSVALAFPDSRWPVILIGCLLLAAFPVIHHQGFHRLINWGCNKFPWNRIHTFGNHLVTLLQSASLLLRTANLYIGLALSIAAWAAQGAGFWWVCSMLGIEIDPLTAMGIYSIGLLAGAASFIPGGLGSTEAAMGFMLISLGADTPTTIAAILIIRIATLWFALLLGVISIGWLETHKEL